MSALGVEQGGVAAPPDGHPSGTVGFAVVPLLPPEGDPEYVVDDDTQVGNDAQERVNIRDEDYRVPSVKGVLGALLEDVTWVSDAFMTTLKLKTWLKMACARGRDGSGRGVGGGAWRAAGQRKHSSSEASSGQSRAEAAVRRVQQEAVVVLPRAARRAATRF